MKVGEHHSSNPMSIVQVDHPMTELDLHEGSMKASSEFRTENCAKRAIEESSNEFWASGEKPAESSFVAMIWFRFKSMPQVTPSKISFMPHQAPGGYTFDQARDWMPSKWEFVGSNDSDCKPNGNWQVLCEDQSGKKINTLNETRNCEVAWEDKPKAFRCLGIRVLETTYGQRGYFAALHRMRMWVRDIE